MKKMNNKGFSLVELIIVIAIMAILAASIAPALIRYIDKSRKSNDVTAAGTIKTAVDSALANEDAYDEVTSGITGTVKILEVKNGAISCKAAATTFSREVSDNLSTIPKIKYKKDSADGFAVFTDKKGSLFVYITNGNNDTAWEIQPELDSSYK